MIRINLMKENKDEGGQFDFSDLEPIDPCTRMIQGYDVEPDGQWDFTDIEPVDPCQRMIMGLDEPDEDGGRF